MIRLIRYARQEWIIPNEEGPDVKVEGMEPDEPTNLIVEGFQFKQLPCPVKDFLKEKAPHFPSNAVFDLYQLPNGAIVEDLLVVPQGSTFQLLGFYGYELVNQVAINEAESVILRVDWDQRRRYLFGRAFPPNADDPIFVGIVS